VTTSDENDASEEDSDKDLVMGEPPRLSSAAARNAALSIVVSFQPPMNRIWPAGAVQKATQIISIFMQSSNTHYNIPQAILSLFLAAINVPEALREVLAHAGLGVSLLSLEMLLDAIRDDAQRLLKELGLSGLLALAFDNLEIQFKPGETTLTRQTVWESITTGVLPASNSSNAHNK